MDLNIFDIILLSITAISTLIGLFRGFVKIAIDTSALLLSIPFAYLLYQPIEVVMHNYINYDVLNLIVSIILSYIACLLILSTASNIIIGLLKSISGGPIDRIIGFFTGLARGLIFSLIIFLIIMVFVSGSYLNFNTLRGMIDNINKDEYPNWIKDSFSIRYLEGLQSIILKILPDSILDEDITSNKIYKGMDNSDNNNNKEQYFNEENIDFKKEINNLLD